MLALKDTMVAPTFTYLCHTNTYLLNKPQEGLGHFEHVNAAYCFSAAFILVKTTSAHIQCLVFFIY